MMVRQHVIDGHIVLVYESCAPIDGVMATYDDEQAAVKAALADGAHLHEEEDPNDPGMIYFECDDAACLRGGER